MRKTIAILLFSLLLTACSSNKVNIDRKLYSDGEKLIQTLYERTENNIYKMDDDLDNQFNNFDAKYDLLGDDWSKEEKNYLLIISFLKTAYLENHLEPSEEHLKNFHDNIERLKTEYGVKF